jgi:predicted nucleic acid-binding protein
LKVLFDTNVVLDVLLNRAPFAELSSNLVRLVEHRQIEGYLCATTITTIDYLVTKTLDRTTAKSAIQKLLQVFDICEVNSTVLKLSINADFKDFEDSVQHYSAQCKGVDAIVTRNIKDYKQSLLPVYTPGELWAMLNQHSTDL